MFINTLTNCVINGGFHFWQRNTSFATIADATYMADRWKYKKSGTMVHTVTRSTDIPSTAITPYSLLATVTTAQAALSTTGLCYIQQLVEGNFSNRLLGKKLALAFWVKSSKTGTYCVRLSNSAQNKVLVREYTVSSANTWERKVIRISHDSTGTWVKDTGIGFEVDFILGAGTSYNTATENVWGTSNLYATANQINALDTVGGTFQLSEVVLIEDNTEQTRVPNFVTAGRDFLEELVLCQRYFEKSYPVDVVPGTPMNYSDSPLFCHSASTYEETQAFLVEKRVAPTPQVYHFATGAVGTIYCIDNGGVYAPTNMFGTRKYILFSSASFVGKTTAKQWTADAEL